MVWRPLERPSISGFAKAFGEGYLAKENRKEKTREYEIKEVNPRD